MMKRIDYSNIRSVEELKRRRLELDVRSLQVRKNVKTGLDDLKDSLSFANLVASMFSNVSVLLTEVDYFKKLFLKIKGLFGNEEAEDEKINYNTNNRD